jgi:hypothetical protein
VGSSQKTSRNTSIESKRATQKRQKAVSFTWSSQQVN